MDPHHTHDHQSPPKHTSPRRLPTEWTSGDERYTEEIMYSSLSERMRNIVAIDRIELAQHHENITPDNNQFFEERSNPLSSKGN